MSGDRYTIGAVALHNLCTVLGKAGMVVHSQSREQTEAGLAHMRSVPEGPLRMTPTEQQIITLTAKYVEAIRALDQQLYEEQQAQQAGIDLSPDGLSAMMVDIEALLKEEGDAPPEPSGS